MSTLVPETYTKEILEAGSGEAVSRGREVTVHCTGYGKNRDLNSVRYPIYKKCF